MIEYHYYIQKKVGDKWEVVPRSERCIPGEEYRVLDSATGKVHPLEAFLDSEEDPFPSEFHS